MIRKLHHNAYRCRDSEETRRFYEDFLGRAASQGEINAWLNSGGSALDIAQGITFSAERYAREITGNYQDFLGRAPEAGAVAAWQGAIQSGLSLQGLESAA